MTALQSDQQDNMQTIANILIVDESAQNIEQFSQVLHDHFDINFATDAQTASQLMAELTLDLVLIGFDCQSFDGLALCSNSDVPVILYSQNLNQHSLVAGYQAGAVEVVSREIPSSELNHRISAQVSINHSRKALINEAKVKSQMISPAGATTPSESIEDRAKVLLVDDSVSNIQVLNEILCEDYEIFFATNGKQAIQMALEQKPDLIVLDVIMPQMDGYMVCEHLKSMQETKEIGVIFVTSLNDVEDEAKGLQMGAIDYIVKPYSAHIVRARMHNHIELIQHRKMLSSLSTTDGLTAIANRRQFDQVLHRELHRAIRQQEAITLMLIDIDNFKKYNDLYGHVNGDECLKEIAAVLDDSRVRMTDFVARYGGEEFAIILPNTVLDGAMVVAEKVLNAIRGLGIEHGDNCDYGVVTASIGVYSAVPEFDAVKEQLIQLADEALYKAKSQGRNRVVISD